jgi:hypothetical protein
MKTRLKNLLFSAGDRLCARAGAGSEAGVTRPWLFWAGHQVAELGWRLR